MYFINLIHLITKFFYQNNKVNESNGSSKVQFKIPESDANDNQHLNKWSLGKEKRFSHVEHQISGNLKRSKSLTSADTLTFMKLNGSSVKQISIFNEYDMFPEKIQDLIRQAIQSKISSRFCIVNV